MFQIRLMQVQIIILLILLPILVDGLPDLIFRLDDIQCDYLMELQFAIIELFVMNQIPLVVGVITGPGDCYAPQLKALYDQANGRLEIASHSVTHTPMIDLTLEDQIYQVNASKIALETIFGKGTIRTFIPPFDSWNYNTATACTTCGYDIFSPECSSADVGHTVPDCVCTTNMYTNVPAFFPKIDGLTHIPIGSSVTSLYGGGPLIPINQLFNGTLDDCYSGICSVNSQIVAMIPYLEKDEEERSFSAIMMHPVDFTTVTQEEMESYLLSIFDYVIPRYNLVTFQELAGTSRPYVDGIRPPPNGTNCPLSYQKRR